MLPPDTEAFCYVTTTGRVTGKPHEIEIWYATRGSTFYLLSGGRDRADWVRNLRADPKVRVRVGDLTFSATARIVDDPDEDAHARRGLLQKYQVDYSGDLTAWSQRSLPVAIDLEP